ncbi:MAG: uroporphyrinogen-III C-methyltransferase [Acidimicrobiales bacterium]|nr:uroporphyrinogen-III C-methyltransferase [Acidimicrobiales bacterium]
MTVYLVGAGPGDPSLLTVRAAELVASAEFLVHDRLVTPEVLAMAPDGCEVVDVGKSAGWSPIPQAQINALLVEHGRSGRRVVRLKGGDPFVFGRGGEEAVALLEARVPFEIVPGISAAVAAPAAAGIPVTMRQRSLSFTVVTGHEEDAGFDGVDWEALAASGTTLVILMGASRMGVVARRLMAGGLTPTTPVAAVRWATTDRQEVLRTDLVSVGQHHLEPPTTVVVGAVADLDLRWVPTAPA